MEPQIRIVLSFEDLRAIAEGNYYIDEHGRPMPGYYRPCVAEYEIEYTFA